MDRSSMSSPIAVCTMWEGDYHKGVGTLVNSLVRAGFKGKIWAGYRGPLPLWAEGGRWVDGHYLYRPAPDVDLIFVTLHTNMHFTQYKPTWCLQVLQELDIQAKGIFYFDPDVFILAPWNFFEEWLNYGLAVCEDSHLPLNGTHPLAHRWRAFAEQMGFRLQRPADSYLNGGLLGIRRDWLSFLEDWKVLLERIQRDFGTAGQLKTGKRYDMFHAPDQDAFTISSWLSPYPISRVGIDGMGFARGEWLTLHATGPKPWRRRVMLDVLKGGVLGFRTTRLYWELASGPIQTESAFRIQCRTRFYALLGWLRHPRFHSSSRQSSRSSW